METAQNRKRAVWPWWLLGGAIVFLLLTVLGVVMDNSARLEDVERGLMIQELKSQDG